MLELLSGCTNNLRLRKTNHATSVFASTSDRIRIAGAIDKDIPPPGSYNVESSYHESQS
jgi:hypothetical protein